MVCGVSFFKNWLSDDAPASFLGESIWIYLFSRNPIAIVLALATIATQWMILRAFNIHTDVEIYSPSCDDVGKLTCELWELGGGTVILVFFILFGWTLSDMMTGWHLVSSTFLVNHEAWHQKFRMGFAGLAAFGVGVTTLVSSFTHIVNAATSDLEALFNVVGILYVMDIDEAIFASISKFAPHWHQHILDGIEDEFRCGISGKPSDEESTKEGKNDKCKPDAAARTKNTSGTASAGNNKDGGEKDANVNCENTSETASAGNSDKIAQAEQGNGEGHHGLEDELGSHDV